MEVMSHEKSTPLGWLIHSLPLEGKMILPENQILRAEFPNASKSKIESICMGRIDQEVEAWIDQGKIPDGRLFIRRREPGDLFQPIGSYGHKKVKDWMIDRKWSQLRKERTPMIVDKNGRILWIPGFAPSESVKLDEASNRVIRLTYAVAPT